MIDNETIQLKFNRHIGRVMTYLDAINANEDAKYLVKGELWTLCNDLKAMNEVNENDEKSRAKSNI